MGFEQQNKTMEKPKENQEIGPNLNHNKEIVNSYEQEGSLIKNSDTIYEQEREIKLPIDMNKSDELNTEEAFNILQNQNTPKRKIQLRSPIKV